MKSVETYIELMQSDLGPTLSWSHIDPKSSRKTYNKQKLSKIDPIDPCLTTVWPPKYEKTDAKVQEPTNNQQTMAVVLAVKKIDSFNVFQLSAL